MPMCRPVPKLKATLRVKKICALAETHFKTSQAPIASRRAERMLVLDTNMPRLLPFWAILPAMAIALAHQLLQLPAPHTGGAEAARSGDYMPRGK